MYKEKENVGAYAYKPTKKISKWECDWIINSSYKQQLKWYFLISYSEIFLFYLKSNIYVYKKKKRYKRKVWEFKKSKKKPSV